MRKTGLMVKIKMAIYFIFCPDVRHVRVMSCGICGKLNIVDIVNTKAESTDLSNNTYTWEKDCKCLSCGAECHEKQVWK